MEISVNYMAVLLAAVASYAFGVLWHSPLGFSKYWMKLMDMTPERWRSLSLTPAQAMLIGFVMTLLFSYVLAHFVALVSAFSLTLSFQLGFWVWLGFVVTTLANGWLWEGKSVRLFVFNAVYQLISIEIMAAILGIWR